MLVEQSTKRVLESVRRTALLVEDDPRLQRSMSKELVANGFDVFVAAHYDAAVLRLATRDPHVICIDVGLPSKSGYELCEYIRRSLRLLALPILMMSDCGSPGDMAHAEDAGGNAFLRKPCSMKHFGQSVESLLNTSGWGATPRHQLQLRVPAPAFAGYVVGRRTDRPILSAA